MSRSAASAASARILFNAAYAADIRKRSVAAIALFPFGSGDIANRFGQAATIMAIGGPVLALKSWTFERARSAR